MWWLGHGNCKLPKDKPRRGTTLPVVMRDVASKLCSVAWVCRSAFTNKLDESIGLIKDLRNRIMRLNNHDSEAKAKLVSISLSEQHGKLEGTSQAPNEYDALTASKTCNRLHNAIKQLGECQATRQAYPDHEENPFKDEGDIPKDLHFPVETVNPNKDKPKEGSTSADLLLK